MKGNLDKRSSTSDIVYMEIKKRIVEMEYEPKQQLTEESLAQDLGISRTPLRQAMYRLELEQLVVKHTNGRIYVAPITIEEAKEIFKVREVLEGLIAREATMNMKEKDIQQLKNILVIMKQAAQENRRYDLIKHGSEFHYTLYGPSQNQTTIKILEQLNSRIERYRRIGGYKNPGYIPMQPVDEHEKILDLMIQGEAFEVEKLMRSHIRRSLETTLETLTLY